MNRPRTAERLLLILFLLVSACRGSDNVVWHPTPANIQTVSDPQFILHEDTVYSGPWAELLSGDHVTIGAEEGEPLDMIGLVYDMAIGRNYLYYSDFVHSHVREYDFQGNLINVVGQRGVGPGEFPLLNRIAFAVDEAILVVAGGSNQVLVFGKEVGVWVHKKSFTVPHLLRGDLCAMDGHVYTAGYSEETTGVIHKYTLEGEHILSFGTPYNDPSSFIRTSLSQRGHVACNATSNVVAYTHTLSPVITGFSHSGNKQWQVELADADIGPVKQTFTEDGRPSIGFTSAPSRTGILEFISTPDSESFFVRYSAKDDVNDDRNRYDKWHLYSIDAATGHGVYVGWYPYAASQPVMGGLDNRNLYTITYEPTPQIRIYPGLALLP